MRTLEEIKKEIEELEVKDQFGTWWEMKLLPKVLEDDEHIKALSSGQKIKLLSYSGFSNILLVCTTKRILMIDRKLVRSKVDEIKLSNVTHIERKDGLVLSKLVIESNGGKKIKLRRIAKDAARVFCIEAQKESLMSIDVKDEKSKNSMAEELKELKGLLDDGILTQEEFEIKKKQLLGI